MKLPPLLAPAKLYKALVKDADNIIPKAVEAIQSIETVEGNGGPGTTRSLSLRVSGESKNVLHKIEAIDEANFGNNYSIVGGVGLPETMEKASFEAQLVAGPTVEI
ncbi:START-like domain superfamily [Sesbania bispinosa]|nr:START-like domain superfamily [Sesbania bispinosa]